MSGRDVVAVMGGTFDPVHRGHLEIAGWLYESLRLARMLLLPCAVPPHKDPEELTPARHREAMLQLALRDYPGLELCRLELRTGGVCYTIDSLRRLRDHEGIPRPVFVLGMDALVDLPTWREFERLIEEFDLLVVDRERQTLERALPRIHPSVAARLEPTVGPEQLAAALASADRPGRIFSIHHAPIEVSSSAIRRRIAERGDLDELVPPAVARYIQHNSLYRQEDGS